MLQGAVIAFQHLRMFKKRGDSFEAILFVFCSLCKFSALYGGYPCSYAIRTFGSSINIS